MENTRNLFEFTARERQIAAKLLMTVGTELDHTVRLESIVTVEFNPGSGFVFLIDRKFNVAMMNGDVLEDWHLCPQCGIEGFKSDFLHSSRICCRNYAKEYQHELQL